MKPIKQVTLPDLAFALAEGKDFYEDAAAQAPAPDLKALFKRIAVVRGYILKDLEQDLAAVEDSVDTASAAGRLSRNLSGTFSNVLPLVKKEDRSYLCRLGESESQLLSLFERIYVDEKAPPTVATAVGRWRSEVRACRDCLMTLAPSTSAA